MKRFNLRPALTVAGIVVPFVIAVLLYNSTKERNEEILEVQTSTRNSESIIELQIQQNDMEAAIADLSAQFSKTQSDYNKLVLALEGMSSDRSSNRQLMLRLEAVLDRLAVQDDQIDELQRQFASSSVGPQEIEAIVIETIERLLRTNR